MKRNLFFIYLYSIFAVTSIYAKPLNVNKVLKNIVAPKFPNQEFNVMDYGATNDGITDSRTAINKAITTCSVTGGGIVIVGRGSIGDVLGLNRGRGSIGDVSSYLIDDAQ